MRARWVTLGLAVGLAAVGNAPAQAEVRAHGLFSSGAVLQQGRRIPVWGTAEEGERVTVRLNGSHATAQARGGHWKVYLPPQRAGGPHTLTITGSATVGALEVRDVLVGEVWVASGQSNMEWPLSATNESGAAIAASADPYLRLLTIPRTTSPVPLTEVTSRWEGAGPQTTPRFSAVAYYFGRRLRQELKVPVGLINASWGGTVAEAWTSNGALTAEPVLAPMLARYAAARRNYPLAQMQYSRALEEHRVAAAAARAAGKPEPQAPRPPQDPTSAANPNRPSVLYNGMIAPLVPYAIRGAIWYQGESNAGRAWEYQTLMPTLIRDWRAAWGQGDFSFYMVQLAPFFPIKQEPSESAWAELREAQRLTALRLPGVGMAVITDAGDERDIHPRDKKTVGERLAAQALARDYHRPVAPQGPEPSAVSIRGKEVVVRFRHTHGGLQARGGKLTGFTIADAGGRWHPAEAVIRGNTVVVSSPQVPHPVAVRYGWWDYPVVNLWNGAGLPATPFRTDDFPLTTRPTQ